MKLLRGCVIVCFLIALMGPSSAWPAHRVKHRKFFGLTAHAALLWDPARNDRYFDRNADSPIHPASTTKVLTAVLALERLPLDQYVTVSAHAAQAQPTKLGLIPGEQYRVRDLLYAVLLKSANDAAVVLAEAAAGSQEQFVALMNARAQQMGARHSHFTNPHGLPSQGGQYTTAADMALIFKEALKNDFFRQAITLKYRIIYAKEGRRHFLKSHNKSLFLHWKKGVFGKTGYTLEARSCFVGYVPKGNDILIVAVFGCHNRQRWDDIKFVIERYGHIDL